MLDYVFGVFDFIVVIFGFLVEKGILFVRFFRYNGLDFVFVNKYSFDWICVIFVGVIVSGSVFNVVGIVEFVFIMDIIFFNLLLFDYYSFDFNVVNNGLLSINNG